MSALPLHPAVREANDASLGSLVNEKVFVRCQQVGTWRTFAGSAQFPKATIRWDEGAAPCFVATARLFPTHGAALVG